jgi:XTP/dITP diphosphohydrolase
MKLLIASQNKHKIEEIKQIFDLTNIELLDLDQFNDDDDVVEDGKTFLDNAILKAKYFANKYHIPTLSDDSGLVVEALDGRPGINSKRYSGGNDKDNYLKLLEEMKNISNRKAYFITVIAIYFPDGHIFHYEGKVHGEIAIAPKGTHGFGYDPIFYLPSLDKHMAELDADRKNQISHRGQALKHVKEHMNEIINYK